jgi:hypothetical protein
MDRDMAEEQAESDRLEHEHLARHPSSPARR